MALIIGIVKEKISNLREIKSVQKWLAVCKDLFNGYSFVLKGKSSYSFNIRLNRDKDRDLIQKSKKQ